MVECGEIEKVEEVEVLRKAADWAGYFGITINRSRGPKNLVTCLYKKGAWKEDVRVARLLAVSKIVLRFQC